jgi:hypothetical protein
MLNEGTVTPEEAAGGEFRANGLQLSGSYRLFLFGDQFVLSFRPGNRVSIIMYHGPNACMYVVSTSCFSHACMQPIQPPAFSVVLVSFQGPHSSPEVQEIYVKDRRTTLAELLGASRYSAASTDVVLKWERFGMPLTTPLAEVRITLLRSCMYMRQW